MADFFWWPVGPLLALLVPPLLLTVLVEKKLFTNAALGKVRWLRFSLVFVGLLVLWAGFAKLLGLYLNFILQRDDEIIYLSGLTWASLIAPPEKSASGVT